MPPFENDNSIPLTYKMFALFIHIYNHDSWEKIFREQLIKIQAFSPLILINLCLAHPDNSELISLIRDDFPDALIITTPNKGRDIGGKLALIDFFLKADLRSEYIVFLHDKQSHHWFRGESWRQKLFEIIEPGKVRGILEEYRKNPKTGIMGAIDFIKEELDKKTNEFNTTNNRKIKELITVYGLKLNDYRFVAGAMFWVRSQIINRFFSIHSALGCREMLEEGNFTDQYEGTYTHSWERIFCFLANDQDYTIKGI
jgi:lipopolysaccharide biosynthesis protein